MTITRSYSVPIDFVLILNADRNRRQEQYKKSRLSPVDLSEKSNKDATTPLNTDCEPVPKKIKEDRSSR